jgi:hypothetical protein
MSRLYFVHGMPVMKSLLIAAVLTGLLTTGVQAQATEKRGKPPEDRPTDCKTPATKGKAGCDGISPEDKQNLDRAMSRNMLQSIDDQLRRLRTGN